MITARVDAKNKCREKLKQDSLNLEKTTLENIEKSSILIENELNEEFQYFKEQNLAKLKKYYDQILLNDRLRHEKQLSDIQNKHEKTYNNVKTALEKRYKEILDSKKVILREKLTAKDTKTILELLQNTKENKIEMFKAQIDKKLKILKRKDQQLIFIKDKIKNILNNYINIVTMIEKHNGRENYVVNRDKLFSVYLKSPTEVELEKLLTSDEE